MSRPWTEANVHDPGVTLLEAFAFLGNALFSRRRVVVALGAAAVLLWGCRRLRRGAGAQ